MVRGEEGLETLQQGTRLLRSGRIINILRIFIISLIMVNTYLFCTFQRGIFFFFFKTGHLENALWRK